LQLIELRSTSKRSPSPPARQLHQRSSNYYLNGSVQSLSPLTFTGWSCCIPINSTSWDHTLGRRWLL